MSIVRFNPWREFDLAAETASTWVPAVDVWETPESFRIDVDVPAVAPEAVDVALERGVLSISGERQRPSREEGDSNHRLERRTGKFRRRFKLPESADADNVSARVVGGVLQITIAKHAVNQPRRIEVVAA